MAKVCRAARQADYQGDSVALHRDGRGGCPVYSQGDYLVANCFPAGCSVSNHRAD
ncbi:MAG: hypothetical protein R3F37_08260 [Candidatus Competibacteraceae bacterium]